MIKEFYGFFQNVDKKFFENRQSIFADVVYRRDKCKTQGKSKY